MPWGIVSPTWKGVAGLKKAAATPIMASKSTTTEKDFMMQFCVLCCCIVTREKIFVKPRRKATNIAVDNLTRLTEFASTFLAYEDLVLVEGVVENVGFLARRRPTNDSLTHSSHKKPSPSINVGDAVIVSTLLIHYLLAKLIKSLLLLRRTLSYHGYCNQSLRKPHSR